MLWTLAHQAPLSMKFSRKEYWSGLPFPAPGDLPKPGIEPALQADSLPSEPLKKPWPLRKGDDGNFWNETVFHVLIYVVAILMNTDIQVHLGCAL